MLVDDNSTSLLTPPSFGVADPLLPPQLSANNASGAGMLAPIDNSIANVQQTMASISAASASTGTSIFTTQVPDALNISDGVGSAGDYELGMEFQSSRAGTIDAIRYYKSPSETGTHTGRIWSSTGTLLGSVNFSNETASGWQHQTLATPIAIAANTQYVVSVNANSYFVVTGNGISSTITNGDLSAVADGSNGTYNSTPGLFPTASNNNNYFRDVVFNPATTPTNNVGSVVLKGSATVGRTLSETVIDRDGLGTAPIAYLWQQSNDGRTWANITGATTKDLALTTALSGKQVRVQANYTDALGNRESVNSAGTLINTQNAIVRENQLAGTTAWQINADTIANNNEIAGYGDATSVNKGEALNLKISLAQAGNYDLDVYRLGYYGGNGGRLMTSVKGLTGVTQVAPTVDPNTRLVECKWNTSYTLNTGANWTSGLYAAKLTDSRTGKQSYIEFTVRDDNRPSELGFQDAAMTAQAYNNYGGYSTYTFNSLNNQAAYKVSFDRPLSPTAPGIFQYEYNMARWLESQGYDISYYSNLDVHRNPQQLLSQNAFLSVGHDEYWSLEMRNNVQAARDRGINLGFFSANSAYWRTRLEPSTGGAANRIMAIYKDSWNLDPVAQADNSQATNRFRSPQVNRPENALLGVMYTGLTNNVTGGFDFVVSNAADPYYAGTGLKNGDKIPGLVGYEWDAIVNNGQTPAGLVTLSQSPVTPDDIAPGLPAGTNTGISNSVRYTAASGAKVFSTGSIQWAWGLDSDRVVNPRRSPAAQRITRNVLRDLGAQPRTPVIFPAS